MTRALLFLACLALAWAAGWLRFGDAPVEGSDGARSVRTESHIATAQLDSKDVGATQGRVEVSSSALTPTSAALRAAPRQTVNVEARYQVTDEPLAHATVDVRAGGAMHRRQLSEVGRGTLDFTPDVLEVELRLARTDVHASSKWRAIRLDPREVRRALLFAPPAASISGVVYDEARRPAAGATVSLWDASRPKGAPDATVTSDADGRYSFDRMGREFCVLAAKGERRCRIGIAGEWSMGGGGGERGNLDLFLSEKAEQLVGVVVDEDQRAIQGATVRLARERAKTVPDTYPPTGACTLSAFARPLAHDGDAVRTDANGRFTVDGFVVDQSRVLVSALGFATKDFDAVNTDELVRISLDAVDVVRGHVLLPDGSPAVGARVRSGPRSTWRTVDDEVIVDEAGRFEFNSTTQAGTDRSYIVIRHDGFALEVLQSPVLGAGGAKQNVVTLTPEVPLVGVVVGIDGEPCSGMDLWLEDESLQATEQHGGRKNAYMFAGVGHARTDADGRFVFSHRMRGAATLFRHARAHGDQQESIALGPAQHEVRFQVSVYSDDLLLARVVDDRTGLPVHGAKMRATIAMLQYSKSTSLHGGEASMRVPRFPRTELTVLMITPEVTFSAPGYVPVGLQLPRSGGKPIDLGEVPMSRATPFRLLIVDPDGTPLKKGRLWLRSDAGEAVPLGMNSYRVETQVHVKGAVLWLPYVPAREVTVVVEHEDESHEVRVNPSATPNGETLRVVLPVH